MGTKNGILQMVHALMNAEMQQRLEDLSHSVCVRLLPKQKKNLSKIQTLNA